MTTHSATRSNRFAVWSIVVLVLLSIPIIFYGLGSCGLVDNDEGNYHYMARRMVETGNWTRLELTGEHRVYDTFMNAPIQYWARAALIIAFGDNYWTMRILSASFGLLSVLMTYRLVAYVASARAALLASLIQLTTFQYAYLHCARTGELEPMICFFFTLAAYLFLRAIETGRSFLPHHVCLIVLMNLKLPWIIVPIMAELAYFAVSPEARQRFRAWAFAGLIVPLGLAWHIAQFFALGEDAWAVFQKMAGQASGSETKKQLTIPARSLFYARTMLGGAFPHVLAYPLAIVGLLASPTGRQERLRLRFILLCPAAVIVFFTVVAKKLPWYIIPTYPFLSACLGIWLDRLHRASRHRWIVLAGALFFTMLLCVRAGFGNPFADIALHIHPNVSWRRFFHFAPAGEAAVILFIFTGMLYGGRLLLRARFSTVLAGALTTVLVGFGMLRVLHPLQYTDHVSPMETVAHELSAARAAGKPIRFPILAPGAGQCKVRYFFGDDYEIVNAPIAKHVRYWLVGEGRTSQNPPRATKEQMDRITDNYRNRRRQQSAG